jgi:hypothetical protein
MVEWSAAAAEVLRRGPGDPLKKIPKLGKHKTVGNRKSWNQPTSFSFCLPFSDGSHVNFLLGFD